MGIGYRRPRPRQSQLPFEILRPLGFNIYKKARTHPTTIYNLLKIKIPIQNEESDALWDAASDLVGIAQNNDCSQADLIPLPNADNYKDWFLYHENIDLRRHLQDIEIVLIEAALDKSAGQVSLASEKLKLRRTTLIEKMKKLAIAKPNL